MTKHNEDITKIDLDMQKQIKFNSDMGLQLDYCIREINTLKDKVTKSEYEREEAKRCLAVQIREDNVLRATCEKYETDTRNKDIEMKQLISRLENIERKKQLFNTIANTSSEPTIHSTPLTKTYLSVASEQLKPIKAVQMVNLDEICTEYNSE